MIECAYDAVGCAYLIGIQVALEACIFGKLVSLIFACIMLYMLNHNPVCRYLGYLQI